MVRLVFRPYSRVKWTNCTSVTHKSSVRVSSDVNFLKNSSPPFGSIQKCSKRWDIIDIFNLQLRMTPQSVFQDGRYVWLTKPKSFNLRRLRNKHKVESRYHSVAFYCYNFRSFDKLSSCLFTFPSRYFCSIGLNRYLTLAESYLPFRLQFERILLNTMKVWTWSIRCGLSPQRVPLFNGRPIQQ